MKKLSVLLIVLNLFFQLIADGTPPEGTGTETDPFQIEALDNLLWLSTTETSWEEEYYFLQTEDIDASDTQTWNGGAGFIPIGNLQLPFEGYYNGGGHVIEDLYINRPGTTDIGLFGCTDDASIESLGLTDLNVIGGNLCVGGLVGYNCNSMISECYVSGSVTGDVHVGGLVGWNREISIISGCYTSGNVYGDVDVGGLVGINWEESTISECYASVSVNGGSQNIGGLVGHNGNSTIIESYSSGDVSGEIFVGGLVGWCGIGTINESYYDYENVLINNQNLVSAGALTSELYNDWINNNMNLEITDYLSYDGEYYLINNSEELQTLLAFGQNAEYNYMLTDDIDLSNNLNFFIPYFAGTFDGNYHIIDGLNVDSPANSCIGLFAYTTGATIEALGVTNLNLIGYWDIGGLVGFNYLSTVRESYASGNINGVNTLGGLIGLNQESIISECYANVSVTGSNELGGFVGWNTDSTVSNCFATSSVSGGWAIGGFVGTHNDGSIINDSYACVNVSGEGFTGGFVGNNSEAFVNNSIWNIEISGQAIGYGNNENGIMSNFLGKTTAEMQLISTFTDIGWDFVGESVNGEEDIWDIDDAINEGFPFIYDIQWHEVELNAEFYAETTYGISPLTVNFFDQSSPINTISSWQWDFENDGEIDSYEQNPVWIYDEPGVYTVSLTISDDIRNTETELKENYITVIDGGPVPQGSGTFEDPYQIATLDNLFWLSTNEAVWASNSYFLQTNDIDASDTANWNDGAGFSPIGTHGATSISQFNGSYNGGDHIIDSLFINRPDDLDPESVGLFGYTEEAVITALGVTNVNLNGSGFVGALVGWNIESTISKCFASGSISGEHNVGGLIGWNQESSISECYANCYVNCVDAPVGGLVGMSAYDSTIGDCYATGSVNGGNHAGGLVGQNSEGSTINESYAISSVTGNWTVGGLVGGNYNAVINNSIWNIETSGQTIGVGEHEGGTILNLLGNTTAEMHLINTYTDIGWDFTGEIINGIEDIWDIHSSLNNGYPYISDLEWSYNGSDFLARFDALPVSGPIPLTVNFTDESVYQDSSVTWEWDFENDGVIDSYEQNPVWVYYVTGIYSVCLTISDSLSQLTSTELKVNYVSVYDALQPEGSGTEANPYLVESLQNILWISNNESCWSSNFLQTADIDASDTQYWNAGAGFSPIGNENNPFQGIYVGDNHLIDGLYIYRPDSDFIGFWGNISGVVIEAFGVTNVNVTGDFAVGGLVGWNAESTLSETYATGIVTGGGDVGGLVGGNMESTLSECYALCSVSGSDNVGGLVGKFSDSSLFRSYFSGSVSGEDDTGGLVGRTSNSIISYSYANSNVSGDINVGGFVGRNWYSTLIENYAAGSVNGNCRVGGLAGENFVSTLSESYATGEVIGNNYIGGLVGENFSESMIRHCYANGNVSGSVEVGGLVGRNIEAQIENSIWNIETSGQTIGVGYELDGTTTNLLGNTTIEMLMIDTYTDIGWDFVGESVNGNDDIWDMDDDINDGFPYIYNIENPVINDENEIVIESEKLRIENYPNPFNPLTIISYELSDDVENVSLGVYNVKGQRVWKNDLIKVSKGSHSIIWSGEGLASGIYFYMIRADENVGTGKMILLK